MANAKTLRKRIALVAAAALGVGMLAAAPANATNTASWVKSISLATYTAAPTTGSAVAVNFGASIDTTTATTIGFVGYLSSYPAGGFAQVTPATTLGGGGTATPNVGFSTTISGSTLVESGTATSPTTITATATAGVGSYSFTPTVAGTYVLTVWNEANADGIVSIGEAVQTISITVAAATTYAFSPGLSTAILGLDSTTPGTDDTVSVPKGVVGGPIANVAITLLKSNSAPQNGETVSATITGPGLIAFGDVASTPGTARAASKTLTGNTTFLGINPDGTAGVGTVTISVTDATTGATTVLATKSFSFYGAVASLAVVTQYVFVAKAGGGTSGSTTGLSSTVAPAVTVKALDANGVVVPGQTITGLSSNTAVIASSTVAEDTAGNDSGAVYGGPGYYNASVTAASLTTSGQSATVTYRYTADSGVTYISAPAVTFTLGGTTPASVTFGLDAATYAPGAKATLTITAKDSAGNPVADNTYANLLTGAATASANVVGTLPGASVKFSKGVATGTFFVPATPLAFTISGTLGSSVAAAIQGTVVSATASVVVTPDPNIAAAKAAADAATAAVAMLSVTVASLVASITAQIKALSVLIKKIMAKLKIK